MNHAKQTKDDFIASFICAGGDWYIVKQIINDIFIDVDVTIVEL